MSVKNVRVHMNAKLVALQFRRRNCLPRVIAA